MTWAEVLAAVTTVAFGVLSAIVPIANAEAYVIAAQVSGVGDAVMVATCVGVGQSVGKLLLFLGVRRGRDFRFVRRHRDQPGNELGPNRRRLRAVLDRLLALVGTKRWGLPIVFLAALTGLPPLYAVALLAGATTMRAGLFYVAVLAGRIIRFVLIALGVGHGIDWWSAP
ncbi:MAG: hypothetical protein ACR2LI_09815 [Propionibacteriaceae bacterium]